MQGPQHSVARRTIIKGAGLGIGAGLLSGVAGAAATTGAAAPAASGEIWRRTVGPEQLADRRPPVDVLDAVS